MGPGFGPGLIQGSENDKKAPSITSLSCRQLCHHKGCQLIFPPTQMPGDLVAVWLSPGHCAPKDSPGLVPIAGGTLGQ